MTVFVSALIPIIHILKQSPDFRPVSNPKQKQNKTEEKREGKNSALSLKKN